MDGIRKNRETERRRTEKKDRDIIATVRQSERNRAEKISWTKQRKESTCNKLRYTTNDQKMRIRANTLCFHHETKHETTYI